MVDIDLLIDNAKAAVERSFLTQPSAQRHGAAVATQSGKIYAAGQYSSFNHMTNIHAEMGAVLMATMQGDPAITMLALVTDRPSDQLPAVCGICLQFLYEHQERTGIPITICLSSLDGSKRSIDALSDLLPRPWKGNR